MIIQVNSKRTPLMYCKLGERDVSKKFLTYFFLSLENIRKDHFLSRGNVSMWYSCVSASSSNELSVLPQEVREPPHSLSLQDFLCHSPVLIQFKLSLSSPPVFSGRVCSLSVFTFTSAISTEFPLSIIASQGFFTPELLQHYRLRSNKGQTQAFPVLQADLAALTDY